MAVARRTVGGKETAGGMVCGRGRNAPPWPWRRPGRYRRSPEKDCRLRAVSGAFRRYGASLPFPLFPRHPPSKSNIPTPSILPVPASPIFPRHAASRPDIPTPAILRCRGGSLDRMTPAYVTFLPYAPSLWRKVAGRRNKITPMRPAYMLPAHGACPPPAYWRLGR